MQADETGDRPGSERQQDSRPQLPHDRRPHAHSILLRSLHTAARQGCASDVPRGSGGGTEVFGRKLVPMPAGALEGRRSDLAFRARPPCAPQRHGWRCAPIQDSVPSMSDPSFTISRMKVDQQELPFRQWGGARKGAGRKRQSARPNVPHRPRQGFRKGALHVTLRMRREVWNLRTHRCFRAATNAVRYVLENWSIHAERNGEPRPSGVDPYCSAVSHDCGPPLVADARWWMLRVGAQRRAEPAFAA